MKKLPLLAALSAACSWSVAEAQNVTIYGRLYPYLISEKGSNPTAAGTAVSSLSPAATGVAAMGTRGMGAGNSSLGFRGREDMGAGMFAIFQLEGTVTVDNGAAAGFTWNRNTFVGLSLPWGEIKLGSMDTVQKDYGDTLGILGVSSGTPLSSSNMLRRPGFSTSGASRFHERRVNSIRYDSPEVGGFGGAFQWATEETPLTRTAGTLAAPKTISTGIKYDKGPLYVALAYEVHNNWFGGSAGSPSALRNTGAGDMVTSKDSATQFAVEWRPNNVHKLEFNWIRKEYRENAIATGRFKNYSNDAYLFAVDSRWSPQWRTSAHYVRSQAGSCERVATACSTDGLEGSRLTFGAGYYFSARTMAYSAIALTKNGKSARYGNIEFNNPAPGEDIRIMELGLSVRF